MRRLDRLDTSPEFPTASELYRAGACVAPWGLGLPREEQNSEWTERGRQLHWWAEQAALGVLHEHPAAPPEYHAALGWIMPALDVDRELAKRVAWPDGCEALIRPEIGIKWRPTALLPEVALCERQPGERLRGWFSGTADLVFVDNDGVLYVVDWKFGPREPYMGERANVSAQGAFLAMAFAELLGITGSSSCVVVARFERRMVSAEGIEVDAYDYTQGDLDAFAEALAGLADRLRRSVGVLPTVNHGCGRCSAKAACPAWQAMRAEVDRRAREDLAGAFDGEAPTTAKVARACHLATKVMEERLPVLKGLRDAYVLAKGPLDLGLGVRLEAKPRRQTELLQTPDALDVIEDVVGAGAVELVRKSGLGRVRKAINARFATIKSKADRDKAKAALLAELEARGVLKSKASTFVVQEVRAGEPEEEEEEDG